MIGLRIPAAEQVAGVERRMTAHSGRVGLASELTSPGAPTTDEPLGRPELLVTAGSASLVDASGERASWNGCRYCRCRIGS